MFSTVCLQDGELLRADQEAKAALQRKRALEQHLMVQTQMVSRAHIKVCACVHILKEDTCAVCRRC